MVDLSRLGPPYPRKYPTLLWSVGVWNGYFIQLVLSQWRVRKVNFIKESSNFPKAKREWNNRSRKKGVPVGRKIICSRYLSSTGVLLVWWISTSVPLYPMSLHSYEQREVEIHRLRPDTSVTRTIINTTGLLILLLSDPETPKTPDPSTTRVRSRCSRYVSH